MPTVPKQTKCRMFRCTNERSKVNGFCLEHGGFDVYKEKKNQRRIDFNAMYDQTAWRKIRSLQLSRQPLCQSCLVGSHIKAATVVDHLFSWSHIGKDAFYNNIFQSLCADCHGDKTNLERGGVYRHYCGESYMDHRLNDYASVVLSSTKQ